MFEFQKLDVYQKVRLLNKAIFAYLKDHPSINRYIKDQWSRATLSIPLDIAEGSSQYLGYQVI
jgi:four helix bundle protein